MTTAHGARVRPDYAGGNIVNLMSSLVLACGGPATMYPPLAALDPASLHGHRNLVLLVIDGLGFHYLAGTKGVLRDHLVGRATSVFPSSTASAVTSFFTALAPQQHALTGWHIYFEELARIVAVLPFRPRYGFPPLAQPEREAALLFDQPPVLDRLAARAWVVAPARIIDSVYNVTYSGGAQRKAYTTREELFAALAALARRGTERQFVYAYYPEVDRLAHEYGTGSDAVAAEVAALDAGVGRLLGAIKGSDTAIVVTADHGFIDCPPAHQIEVDAHPRFAETLRLPLAGEQRVAYCYVREDRREQFTDYVATRFADQMTLIEGRELIAQGYFGLGAPHPRLASRVGDYALLLQQDYAIKDWTPGERRFTHVGFHGGLSPQEMEVPVVVATA